MTSVQCFLIEPTTWYQVWARRYTSSKVGEVSCGAYSHHSAKLLQAVVEPAPGFSSGPPTENERGVFSWPTQCERCPYVFQDSDVWQRFYEHIYRRQDTGEERGLREFEAGAMYRATWFEGTEEYPRPDWVGPDGQCWAVRLPVPDHPNWDWVIDGPSTGGGRWTRTGVPPKLTVTPSIGAGPAGAFLYHGFLTDGVLIGD